MKPGDGERLGDKGYPLEVCERVKEAQAIALEEFGADSTPDTGGHHPKNADTVRESV